MAKTETPPETAVAALVAAQTAMPRGIAPDGRNTFFKKADGKASAYVTLAALSEEVLPHLHANGLALTCSVTNGEAPARMVATLYHVSGETLEFGVPLGAASMNDAQKVGSAITYARRQLLGMISGIAPDADDDGNAAAKAAKEAEAKRREAELKREAQSAEIGAQLKAALSDCETEIDLAAIGAQIKDAKPDLLNTDVTMLKGAYRKAAERIEADAK